MTEPKVPISDEQALHMFLQGLDLIRQSELFEHCGAYIPGGYQDEHSEIVAIYLSNDEAFTEHCEKFGNEEEGEIDLDT